MKMSTTTQPHRPLTKLVNAPRNQFVLQMSTLPLCITAVILFFCLIVPKILIVALSSFPPPNATAEVRTHLGLSSQSTSSRLLILPQTEQEDLFISVKTSKQFHESRLALVLRTWFQLAKEQIWFFSDADDAQVQKKTSK